MREKHIKPKTINSVFKIFAKIVSLFFAFLKTFANIVSLSLASLKKLPNLYLYLLGFFLVYKNCIFILKKFTRRNTRRLGVPRGHADDDRIEGNLARAINIFLGTNLKQKCSRFQISNIQKFVNSLK